MVGSEEFAVQIFDSLARRRGITAQVLTKDQLREFWEQLSDPGFDAKLRTFFDMYEFSLIQVTTFCTSKVHSSQIVPNLALKLANIILFICPKVQSMLMSELALF